MLMELALQGVPMDQFLHWDSHYNMSAKYSVCNTLSHRTGVVCSKQQSLKEEENHIREPLLGVIIPHGL